MALLKMPQLSGVVINNQHPNDDGDPFPNAIDLCPNTAATINTKACDADGNHNGLIDIHSAAELNAIRHNLAGNSQILTAGGTATGGCPTVGNPGTDPDGNQITSCNGYELMTDIDLAAAGYTNWTPLGSCDSATSCPADKAFAGIFNGNGNTISNLAISLSSDSYGVGLFGSASSSKISNLNLDDVDISSSAGGAFVGSLVGYYAGGGNIANIDLDGVVISADGMDRVGGIIGRAEDVLALDSISLRTTENIVGDDSVGGLIGQVGHRDSSAAIGQFTTRSVSIDAADITGTGAVGGLAGRVITNRNSRIYDVAVEADDIRATGTVCFCSLCHCCSD